MIQRNIAYHVNQNGEIKDVEGVEDIGRKLQISILSVITVRTLQNHIPVFIRGKLKLLFHLISSNSILGYL